MAGHKKEHHVVIVGTGFAGFNAARELSRLVGKTTEIVVINLTDYFLYLPVMLQVAGGPIEPRYIRVSLGRRLRKMRFLLGTVSHVDHGQKVVSWTGPEGASGQVGYDRLILTVSGVNKPVLHVRQSDAGSRRLGHERDHACGTDIARGDQRRIRPAQR